MRKGREAGGCSGDCSDSKGRHLGRCWEHTACLWGHWGEFWRRWWRKLSRLRGNVRRRRVGLYRSLLVRRGRQGGDQIVLSSGHLGWSRRGRGGLETEHVGVPTQQLGPPAPGAGALHRVGDLVTARPALIVTPPLADLNRNVLVIIVIHACFYISGLNNALPLSAFIVLSQADNQITNNA